jgi:hypothetical protein
MEQCCSLLSRTAADRSKLRAILALHPAGGLVSGERRSAHLFPLARGRNIRLSSQRLRCARLRLDTALQVCLLDSLDGNWNLVSASRASLAPQARSSLTDGQHASEQPPTACGRVAPCDTAGRQASALGFTHHSTAGQSQDATGQDDTRPAVSCTTLGRIGSVADFHLEGGSAMLLY